MEEIDVFRELCEIENSIPVTLWNRENHELARKVAQHKLWLQTIRKERPSFNRHYKIGVYIRYFNQTKYDDYLEKHKAQFCTTISQCVNWELVDFYIDTGSTPPKMTSSPEWSRLIEDCMDEKVNLIITQKTSNVSKDMSELVLCARVLAAQHPPIGIYFVSEDIFTLATYHLGDLHDPEFANGYVGECLPDDDNGELRGPSE